MRTGNLIVPHDLKTHGVTFPPNIDSNAVLESAVLAFNSFIVPWLVLVLISTAKPFLFQILPNSAFLLVPVEHSSTLP